MADESSDKTTTPNAELNTWAAAWLSHRDEAAARRLMDALYGGVVSIIRARRPRRVAEEDVAQEVFVRFFERLGTWDGRAPLSHWIARITVNQCIDQLRAEVRRPEMRMADLSEDESAALEASWESPEALANHQAGANELTKRLLDMLKPEERVVIEMLDLEGRTATEVESLTGWSSVAIRVRAMRARRKLRKFIERLEQGK